MHANRPFLKIIRIRDAIFIKWWRIAGAFFFKLIGVKGTGRVVFYGLPIVSIYEGSSIEIGEDVVLCSDSRFTALGVSKPVILRTLRPNAMIYIGKNTGISGVVICAAIKVEIGADCLIGADVQIMDTDFHKIDPVGRRNDSKHANIAAAPIVIGNNVFIGAGARVLKGVSIGENCVIGAGSLVLHDIPANSIAAGIPAVVIKKIR